MTSQQLLHPDPQTLRDFNLGRLETPEVDSIERHLAECPPCCETLAGMQDDTFVSLVRGTDTASDAPEDSRYADATLVGVDTAEREPGDVPPELADHARYRVIELLGRGGMGAVYKAEHRLMQRTVALKVVNPRLTGHPAAVERFRREVRTAARLQHPNIVTAHDAEQAGRLHFMVMEYVDGIDLAELVRRHGPLPVAEACEYIRQAALGLQHAHEQGMVHRDIKPQNLMVEVEGGRLRVEGEDSRSGLSDPQPSTINPQRSVKILDFGLAHFASEATTQDGLTEVGAMMGTPDYMAPEQARDAHSADIRADIYSLGCTLYFLLTGRPPFSEGTLVEKVMAHTERKPTPLAKFRSDVPAGLPAVLDRMLAKSPGRRYQTPADVARELALFDGESPKPPVHKAVRAVVAAAALLLLLAGAIITVATDKGTLRIESPPGAEVEIVIRQGGEVQMTDTLSGSTVHRLPSGEYEVDLQGGGEFQLNDEMFTLTRGKTVVLQITRIEAASEVEQILQERDLVANPGFENAGAGAPAYWIAMPKTTPLEPEAVCVRDEDVAYAGQASACIEKPKTAVPVAEAVFMQTIPDLPAGKLLLSGWIKTQNVAGAAAIKLRIVDPQKGPFPVKSVETTAVKGTTGWTRYEAEFEVSAGTGGELALVIQGTGSVWFDEISLMPLDNLLRDGGFDRLDDLGQPPAWWRIGQGVQGLRFEADSDVKHGGTQSATILNTTGGLEPYNWRQEVNVRGLQGRRLRMSGWARTKDAGGAAVGVQLLDAGGRLIAFHTTQGRVDYAGSTDWKRFEFEFIVPAGAERLAVLAMLFGKGQVWFDEFLLYELGHVDAAVSQKSADRPQQPAASASPDPEDAPMDRPVRPIDQLDDEGFSKLHRAAMSGNTELVRELLAEEADPDVRQGTYQGTPLQYASAQGHVEVIRLLLDSGAKADAADQYGRTPLMWAAMQGQTSAARVLLDAKADIEARNDGGWTALRFALSEGHEETARLLIERGAKRPVDQPAPDPNDQPAASDRSDTQTAAPSRGEASASARTNPQPQIRVTGRLVSSEYAERNGRIDRAIVYVRDLATNRHVFDSVFRTDRFEFDLPPGRYRAECTANGSRGATFTPTSKEFSVARTNEPVDLGEIDLPITRTTALFDQPAPELEGITAWWNTEPVQLEDLRGKLVVLDFFSYTCSICHAHKPDLAKLREKYGDRGLTILAIHDDSLKSLPELKDEMSPILHRVFDGKAPKLPMALDGSGERSVFRTYGIGAVPAVLLIDQQGRVVRRFHHAGVPDLAVEIEKLLDGAPGANRRQL